MDKIKEYNKLYYQKYKEKIREKSKRWRLNNPERHRQLQKLYYQLL